MRATLMALIALSLTGCASSGHRSLPLAAAPPSGQGARQTVSLLGRDLYAKPAGADAQGEARLAEARDALRAHPNDPARIVAVGRQLGYLWRINEAIDMYSDGIRKHAGYAPLYRHRGHRYITLRNFDKAIADLERATKLVQGRPSHLEPDGLPGARGPRTTTAFNVWYHLGIARHLNGNYAAALQALQKAKQLAPRTDDHFVATTYWMYLTMRQLNRDQEDAASLLLPIRSDLNIVESDAYFKLLRMFKGHSRPREVLHRIDASQPDIATLGHGVARAHEYNHHRQRAESIWQCVVDTESWPNFGFIAAEVELARSGQKFARRGS